MCTVTFVMQGEIAIMTSNRDELEERQSAEPKTYVVRNKKIVFPKDPKAGGTWFAIDESGNVLVLLNGAAKKHRHEPPYRKSRGLIVLDIISSHSPRLEWESINLGNIEPFTILLLQDRCLYQLRWDGIAKEGIELNPMHNYIWSSSTLYPETIRKLRQKWFSDFMEQHPDAGEKELFDFHRHTQEQNTENGLVIDRAGLLKTVSITQAVMIQNKVSMTHHDLIDAYAFANSFLII